METFERLQSRSPLSLLITFRQMNAARELSFDACLQIDYRLACRFATSHDFMEGIRAAVIDKDQQPKWQPDSLVAVSSETIDEFFAPLPHGDLEF